MLRVGGFYGIDGRVFKMRLRINPVCYTLPSRPYSKQDRNMPIRAAVAKARSNGACHSRTRKMRAYAVERSHRDRPWAAEQGVDKDIPGKRPYLTPLRPGEAIGLSRQAPRGRQVPRQTAPESEARSTMDYRWAEYGYDYHECEVCERPRLSSDYQHLELPRFHRHGEP